VTVRVLIQLHDAHAAAGPGEDVRRILEAARATRLRPSHAELPGLYTALLPDGADVDGTMARLRQCPSVRYAEVDQMRTGL
jgi:hypothetical protein